jgi:predicted membrane-bound mannosyltransferase
MEIWGRFTWWLLHEANAAAEVQTITAIVQAFFTLLALAIAIYVPWKQQQVIARREKEKQDDDTATLRAALREEVLMSSQQCELAFVSFSKYQLALPRSGSLPSLTVFEANASKIGWLNRDEITSLIAFSGTLADIRYLVADLARIGRIDGDDRSNISGMLLNACQYAAKFLEVVGAPKGKEKELETYVTRLRSLKYT